MSQNNFIIQDVVEHVYRKGDYRGLKAIQHALRKLVAKLWVFLLIMGLSAGIGYVAVYLPDSIEKQKESLGAGAIPGMPEGLDRLSDDQKRQLMKQMGGQ
jgi:hypothetical protein